MSEGRKTILVVDDEPEILEIVEMLFAQHQVVTAINVEGALAMLNKSPCDVLITDINMPGASGLSLIDRATECFPNLPVIVITGRCLEPAAEHQSRVFRWLRKPFRLAALQEAVEQAFARFVD